MIKSIATGECYSKLSLSGFSKMLLSRMLSVDVDRRLTFAELNKLIEEKPSELGLKKTMPMVLVTRVIPAKYHSQERESFKSKLPGSTKVERVFIPKENIEDQAFRSK